MILQTNEPPQADGCPLDENPPPLSCLEDCPEAESYSPAAATPPAQSPPAEPRAAAQKPEPTPKATAAGPQAAQPGPADTPIPKIVDRWIEFENKFLASLLSPLSQNPSWNVNRVVIALDANQRTLAKYRWAFPEHRDIFSAIISECEQNFAPCADTVADELTRRGNPGAALKARELGRLLPSDGMADPYLSQMVECGRAAAMYSKANRVQQAIEAGQAVADQLPTIEELRALAEPANKPAENLPDVNVSDLFESDDPPQDWILQGWVARRVVNGLGGHGGSGKTLLALELAACVAVGRDFHGIETTQCRVIYVSLEDPPHMCRMRLRNICRARNIDPAALAENFLLVDGTENPTLFECDGRGIAAGTTPTYDSLVCRIRSYQPGFILIDNASDAFGADENKRAHVRQFITALRKAAGDAGLLLQTHVSAARLKDSRESYSGSTAWHNSMRSRMAIIRSEDYPDQIELRHEKCNLGRLQEPITLQFSELHHLWDRVGEFNTPREHPLAGAVLRLIHEAIQAGEVLFAAPSAPQGVYGILSSLRGWPRGLTKPVMTTILNGLKASGLVEVWETSTGRSKAVKAWRITAAGNKRIVFSADPAQTFHEVCNSDAPP